MPRTLKQVAIDMANAFTRWQLWQGGGSSTLSDLTDVELSDLQTNDVLKYDGDLSKWINGIVESCGIGAEIVDIAILDTSSKNVDIGDYDILIFNTIDRIYGRGCYITKKSNLTDVTVITNDDADTTVINTQTNGLNWRITNRPYSNSVVKVCGIKFAPIVPNLHEYSTDEKVVGKWFDGKHLYEKTITGYMISNFSNIQAHTEYICIHNILGGVHSSNNNDFIPLNYETSISCYQNSYTNISIVNNYYTSRDKYDITIQYTKTTD